MSYDQFLPEDEAISNAHPMRTGRHDLYEEAMRLVGAKYTKGALVELVNWLLARVDAAQNEIQVVKIAVREEGFVDCKCHSCMWAFKDVIPLAPDTPSELAAPAQGSSSERSGEAATRKDAGAGAAASGGAKRKCNRHADCDAADVESRARGRELGADHCHDEGCEECFGN